MIFGEDFGQLAACGEYEVYKKGTTIAQLNAAVSGLSMEEYFDSFLTVADDSATTVEGNILHPFSSTTKIYICDVVYTPGSGNPTISYTTYYNDSLARLVEISKVMSNGSIVRTSKDTSAGTLTLNSWTLYRRQKGYDVASGGSNVAYAIAPVQTSLSSADKNYAVGEQFLYDGHLYKVTTAITSGAQIVIGTNAVAAGTVTEQIKNAKVVVLKESAANKSYATQLSEIESALSGLGDDLYRACIVTRTNQKFSYFGSGRLFSRTYIGSAGGTTYMFYEIFDVTNHTYTEYQGTSATDKSSTTNTTKMQLLLT